MRLAVELTPEVAEALSGCGEVPAWKHTHDVVSRWGYFPVWLVARATAPPLLLRVDLVCEWQANDRGVYARSGRIDTSAYLRPVWRFSP